MRQVFSPKLLLDTEIVLCWFVVIGEKHVAWGLSSVESCLTAGYEPTDFSTALTNLNGLAHHCGN